MKTILCYGDSNTWGAMPIADWGAIGRFDAETRWPGVMRTALGAGHTVIEEGLNGRTSCIADPVEGRHKDGAAFFPVAIESHFPLDLVIIMLGTNDLKARFSMRPGDVAHALGHLVDMARQSGMGPGGAAPQVLLVAPAPFARLSLFAEMFTGGAEKSLHLAPAIERIAAERGAHFFSAATVIRSSDVDGIHLDADAHAALGKAIAGQARAILAG